MKKPEKNNESEGFDYKKWYEANKKAISDRRKQKYHSSNTHREHVLEANRASRERRREVVLKERSEQRQYSVLRPVAGWKSVQVQEDNATVEAFSIGRLARELGRSKLSVRQLEKKGVIPETPHRSESGERLYTLKQICEIKKLMDSQGRLHPKRVTEAPESYIVHVKKSDGSVVQTTVFRIGILAQALGKSTITLEQMERRKSLPKTTLKILNRRCYTKEQIESVESAFAKRGGDLRGKQKGPTLFEEVSKAWDELGLTGAKIIMVVKDEEDKE